MPLVRIDLQEGRTPEEVRRIGDVVQEVMLEVFAAPARDPLRDNSDGDGPVEEVLHRAFLVQDGPALRPDLHHFAPVGSAHFTHSR